MSLEVELGGCYMLPEHIYPFIPVLGLVVGLIVGMTGVGAGSLMTPMLIILGMDKFAAVGTDLMHVAVTKSMGGVVHWRQGTVDSKVIRWLITGSLPAATVMTVVVVFLYSQ